MKETEYLFHYTSLEVLALILKNHTIRFYSLDRMDDLQEQESADIKNAGRFCYVSCWTDDETESIPMWNLYSSIYSGIRIQLPKNPFKAMNPKEMICSGYITPQAMAGCLLFPIEYTNDKEKLYPTLLEQNDEQFTIALGKLGKYKNCYWNFQKEWRYLLHILPVNLNQNPECSAREFQTVANRILTGTAKQACQYLDMQIRDDAFRDMRIIMSPRFSEGNQIMLDSIIKDYNPDAKVTKSELLNLI